MPLPNIKGLKGLGRRKSGGNSIDDATLGAATGGGSSFRVIPRDEATRKSVGGPVHLDGRKDYLPARQNSEEEYSLSNRYDPSVDGSLLRASEFAPFRTNRHPIIMELTSQPGAAEALLRPATLEFSIP
jgi:hypothetical protein